MNPISKSALEKFGNVLDLDAQEFSELITDYRKSYIGKSDNKVRVFSFEEQEFLLNKEKIKDQDISDLFFGGHINKNKLYSNIDSSDYVIQREKALEIMDNIESFDLFLVQSYLGNGKSVFLDVLACLCVQKKYRVYKYNGNPDKIINDLTQLSRINETFIIIIIDDYYSLNKDFKYFSKLDKNKFKFIISGRKSIGQNVINELITKGGFNDEKTKSINLDFISVEEQVSIFNLIDDHNLWGKKSSFSKDKKEQFISITSKHGFKNIALELFKSNNILEKLYISYNKLDIVLKEIVIAHLINITLRYQLKIGQILTLTKRNSLSKATTDIPNFKEFIDIDNNIVNLDSSVAAMELLKKETNKVTIYNVMIEMLKTADKINSRDVYTNFMRGMVSFSNFKLLMSGVNDNQLNNYAVDYYEAIRNTRFAKENPFFWLQYGIQRLNEKEYDMADLFFANALSYATKKGLFDFYQINAQQARSIFERILNEDFPSDVAFDKFIKAHNLLLKDLTNHSNKKYYQLKQIFHYEPFFKQYYNKLTNDQQVAFIFHFNTIKNIFSEYYNDLESAKDKVTLSDMKHVSLSVNKLEKKIIKTNNK